MAKSTSRHLRRSAAFLGLVGLIACGTASDRSAEPELSATRAEALSLPVTYNINVTLPTGTSIVDTTVGASGPIALGPGDNVLGPTASAGGTVEVGGFGTAAAITASGNVQVDATAVVNGNIKAGGLIVPLGQVNGTQTFLSPTVQPYTTT